jgi:hypothetical protein
MSEEPPESAPETPDADTPSGIPVIPVRRKGIVGEFIDFLKHEKAFWMTPIVIVLIAMIAFILLAESSPVLPFIYTVI